LRTFIEFRHGHDGVPETAQNFLTGDEHRESPSTACFDCLHERMKKHPLM
jgi:hypothetical protein